MSICPLAADWGNVSDVISAGTAIVTGGAAAFLAFKANSISSAARLENARISAEAAAERRREARLSLAYLHTELSLGEDATRSLSVAIQLERFAEVRDALDQYADACVRIRQATERISFKQTESVFSRLHVLDDVTAAALGRCLGTRDAILNDIIATAAIYAPGNLLMQAIVGADTSTHGALNDILTKLLDRCEKSMLDLSEDISYVLATSSKAREKDD